MIIYISNIFPSTEKHAQIPFRPDGFTLRSFVVVAGIADRRPADPNENAGRSGDFHPASRRAGWATLYDVQVPVDDRLALRIVRIRSRRESDHASRGEITQI